jgi:hypothetical protein
MFLNVTRQNMDNSFKFDLLGLQSLPNGTYRADLKGTLPLPLTAQISATDATALGTVVKQNLMVPAKAGAELENGCHHHWWCPFYFLVELFERKDTEEPVYVRVQPGSTLWIANYALDDKDVQYVNVDPRGPLPPSGPEGLSPSIVTAPRGKLLVPSARVGELVLSFDNFKTGIGIGQGVQVRVPPGANNLALAINDNQEKSEHHKGTGFRLRITNKPTSVTRAKPMLAAPAQSVAAEEGRIQIVPIADVLPQVCVNGYEDTGHKESIGQQQFEMYRAVGNVCWTVTAILQEGRPNPDKGDTAPR